MAVRIDGSGKYLRRTANLPSSTSFTLCGWCRVINPRSGSWRYLGGIESSTTSAVQYTLIGWDTGNNFELATNGGSGPNFSANPTTGEDFAWAISCSGTGAGGAVAYWRPVNQTTWYSVSATGSSFTPAVINVGNDSWDEWVDCRIWNVKCWDRVLTDAELLVESYYRRVKFPSNLNFHWTLDSVDDYYDYSGNARPPTAGGTLTTEDSSHGLWVPKCKVFSLSPQTVNPIPYLVTAPVSSY